MEEENVVKGFKVFHPDWSCRDKVYTCPGKFEEDITPSICDRGMHFCKKAADCFNYYSFDSKNKIAEVIAYGDVIENDDKCCTNKLEIVREIPWNELLEIVNSGNYNSGYRNSGNRNSGDYNSGNRNSGDYNSGNRNSGDYNSGNYNSGDCNSGNYNSGNYNSGNRNSGNRNSGNYNSGNYNSGYYNSGDCNSGYWNKCNFSNGCFNTMEPKIYLFNKPSTWTYRDWLRSDACCLLSRFPMNVLEYIPSSCMTEEEKEAHPEAKITGGYLKKLDTSKNAVTWWQELSEAQKKIIMELPNFDKEIFQEITGIDVDAE